MPGRTISIDPAVSGFQRHRFIRATVASCLVLIGLLFAGLAIAPFLSGPPADVQSASDGAIFYTGVVFFSVLLFAGSVLVSGWVFGVIHRRLSAFVMLFVALTVFVFGAAAAMGTIAAEFGVFELRSVPSGWERRALATFCFAAAVISLEAVGWAWWQMTLDRAHFFAARGWRAPPWRILSMGRQVLGLPASFPISAEDAWD